MFQSLTRLALIGAFVLCASSPALAHEGATFAYPDFEVSVPHIDLDECPAGLAAGDVFCRITMNNDALHIYVFEAEGDQHFVSVHTYFDDEFDVEFGR